MGAARPPVLAPEDLVVRPVIWLSEAHSLGLQVSDDLGWNHDSSLQDFDFGINKQKNLHVVKPPGAKTGVTARERYL